MTVVTQEKLNEFLVALNEAVEKDYGSKFSRQAPKITIQMGSKYARLVSDERSAFGFIDLTNGDLLKAAGWKAPAKNFARGNIFADGQGISKVRWTGIQ